MQIREFFTLRHHFRPEDLFEYGMQPQFLSRFDNAIILEDLNARMLQRIFLEPRGLGVSSCRRTSSRSTASTSRSPTAPRKRVADEAAKSSRIGARALKAVWGRVIKPFEFDPFVRPEVKKEGETYRLVVDEKVVNEALKSPF